METAFTRSELLALIAVLLAVLCAFAPASQRAVSQREVCFNNLRLIGRAVQMFAGDHGQQTPWRTLVSDGGTRPDSGAKPPAAWFEYLFLSNELVTPKILACPADSGVQRAHTFSAFSSAGYRDNALSYVVGLDTYAENPSAWISGDRNLSVDVLSTACSARVSGVPGIFVNRTTGDATVAWTNGVAHEASGHLLLLDGSVEFTSTTRLRQMMRFADENGSIHFLKVR